MVQMIVRSAEAISFNNVIVFSAIKESKPEIGSSQNKIEGLVNS